jgi:signal transduction histidine kinase
VPTLSLPFAVVPIAGSPPATDGRPAGTAYLWFSQPIPGVPPPWVAQVATTMALLLTLSLVGWFLARSVLQPLAAMSKAARQIARGDLDVRLPPSRTREVAEVAEALGAMSLALREAQARQTALEEERRLFIGAIAHDLRTPLFALRGYLKGLESGVVTTPERVAHYIRACSARADALETLIAERFAYARIEYLAQAPQREPLELGGLIEEAVESARPAAVVKGVTLTLHAPSGPCRLLGDGRLLRRAVQNLLDNALRHTPAGGCVRALWHREGAQLVFQIADTGAGIAPGDLPHLFAPLYRAESSRNRRTGGAGLGLTIARRILQAHGGDLSAANGAEGGAVFTGIIPAGEASPPRFETDQPSSVPAGSSVRG